MSHLFRDKGRPSADRFDPRSSDEILQSMRDELARDKRMFFEPPSSSWTDSSVNPSPFSRGFPFDSDRGARSSRLQKHLDEIAARHPEFAEHLRPSDMASAKGQRTRQPSGGSSGVFSEDDVASDSHSQTSDETPKQPEAARKLPQYGLRNTVDLGGAAQQLADKERNQRSWSAPPESRTTEEQPKRFVSRIEIQPSTPRGPAEPPAPAGNPSSNPGKPPVPPKPKGGERVIPIFVEGRSEPLVPKDVPPHDRPQQPPPQPPPQQPFPERRADFDDFTDFAQFPSRAFGDSAFADRFARPPDFPARHQRHFGEPFWAHRPGAQQGAQQPPPSPPQKRPMAAQSPPTKRTPEKAPPANDPLSKVAVVQKDVDDLMQQIEQFSGESKSDKQYLFLDEMLTRNLIKLDDIETDGKEEIRKVRKEAIRSIQRAISLLESRVRGKTEEQSAGGAEQTDMHVDNDECPAPQQSSDAPAQ
ncbi:BAG domain-containing protein Samui [Neocloeon triangulifer]|uniref:BAG domain-containing protein Samui n=1 Tax=Neocloeon triangulifer TaxID=2078957 RepID=UPI00286ECB06|nr:BAG domain-containing protein Samui [Neocloeon triangulifer]